MEDLKFENIFKISTKSMRLNRCHPEITRDKLWIIQLIATIMLLVSCFFFLLYSVLTHDLPNKKFAETSKNIIMAIVAVTILLKYVIIIHYRDSIANLIRIIDNDYEMAKGYSDEDFNTVSNYSKRGIKVCKLWFICTAATSSIFALKALIEMAYSYWSGEFKFVAMFDVTYPNFLEIYKNKTPVFCCLFWLCVMFSIYATTMYAGFDPLVPIFMLHTCGQIDIINRRIMELFTNDKNKQEIQEHLKKIIIKLQDIYRFVSCVKTNFTILYEYNIKTTTFLLPLTAFQIVESLRNKELKIEFMTFFSSVILHFYMPCYYSNLLMDKSESLRQAIYTCGWEQHPETSTRRTILFMLLRTTRPLVLSTVFFPICLDTFAEMCRQSYAIFNIMNAAWA